MKNRISFLFLLFVFAAFSASAQTAETKPQATPEKKVWVPDKVIPVAEFYEGGVDSLYKDIYKELKYPPLAKRNRVQGDVIISFVLNEDGSTSSFKVLRNPGGGTGDEALRVVKLLKFKAPGYAMNATMPIMFKL
ncbi:energy transducer TonB [Pontibacter sp. 172403-2]|uniref:energy transducer TonB n=1 Tax=Pontibacter rufus TaxID=2791028 RepID=UPI0018AFCA4C|nr:energy transducer TonB [Pontibacter sp. 172403-2]MBF9252359.1 energy transducer TonB [Pontibacter sp. 172403-2]